MRDGLESHVVAVEYPGYGLTAKDEPSEDRCVSQRGSEKTLPSDRRGGGGGCRQNAGCDRNSTK